MLLILVLFFALNASSSTGSGIPGVWSPAGSASGGSSGMPSVGSSPLRVNTPQGGRSATPLTPGTRSRVPSPLTPCQMELQSGRYPDAIAALFPPLANGQPSVIARTVARNIFCHCETGTRMVCRIICISPEMENIVNTRLDSRNPSRLRPFFVNPLLGAGGPDTRNVVLFVHEDATPVVIAEINSFMENDSPNVANFLRPLRNMGFHDSPNSSRGVPIEPEDVPLRLPPSLTQIGTPNFPAELPPDFGVTPRRRPISRSQSLPLPANNPPPLLSPIEDQQTHRLHDSAPMSYHYPDKYIPLYICTGGFKDVACPITHKDFELGQTVYVLKREVSKIKEGKPVGCILAEGLVQLSQTQESVMRGGFKDPLRRTSDRTLTINTDFQAYVISNEPSQVAWVKPLYRSPSEPQFEASTVVTSQQISSQAGPSSVPDITSSARDLSSPLRRPPGGGGIPSRRRPVTPDTAERAQSPAIAAADFETPSTPQQPPGLPPSDSSSSSATNQQSSGSSGRIDSVAKAFRQNNPQFSLLVISILFIVFLAHRRIQLLKSPSKPSMTSPLL